MAVSAATQKAIGAIEQAGENSDALRDAQLKFEEKKLANEAIVNSVKSNAQSSANWTRA